MKFFLSFYLFVFAFAQDFEVDIKTDLTSMLVKRSFLKNVLLVMVVRVLELVEHHAFLVVNTNLGVIKIQISSLL